MKINNILKTVFLSILASVVFFVISSMAIDDGHIENNFSISGTVLFPKNSKFGDSVCITADSAKSETIGGTQVFFSGSFVEQYTIEDLTIADDYIVFVWSDQFKTELYKKADRIETAKRIDTSKPSAKVVNFVLKEGSDYAGM
jgi:hypothetical protein